MSCFLGVAHASNHPEKEPALPLLIMLRCPFHSRKSHFPAINQQIALADNSIHPFTEVQPATLPRIIEESQQEDKCFPNCGLGQNCFDAPFGLWSAQTTTSHGNKFSWHYCLISAKMNLDLCFELCLCSAWTDKFASKTR